MTEKRLTLLLTQSHPCSYLAGKAARTAFVDPEVNIDLSMFSRLAELGFRRSGKHVYRPQCQHCNACIPTRVCVQTFKPNRQQLRCLKRNTDLQVKQLDSIDGDNFYALYEKYINNRHNDGDMYPATHEQYREFLCARWPGTFYLTYYLGDHLLAVSVCDRFDHGYSAVYTFFDPDEKQRSLGVYAILNQIARAQLEGLDHLYLGYWIKDCAKMRYKIDYRPLDLLINSRWKRVN